MDTFVTRKRKAPADETPFTRVKGDYDSTLGDDADTDVKLATLASLLPDYDQGMLLDALISADGSVEGAISSLTGRRSPSKDNSGSSPQKLRTIGLQTSLSKYRPSPSSEQGYSKIKLTRRGQTLHLYTPEDVAAHTPCSIIHNFLPTDDAEKLLKELLGEAPTFESIKFRMFDNIVHSPHSACFYVDDIEERRKQQTEYLYNGAFLTDVREILPNMRSVKQRVKEAVNKEITKRIQTHYPDQKKLKHQSSDNWEPNAAFVNCYAGGAECVGYHSDQLTYLGPRAVIGSISLGVAREFRVRKIVPPDDSDDEGPSDPKKTRRKQADEQGQIAIHLPHNSLLVMHAEMQEEWKHSIAPAQSIDPHPVAGNRRINITYRHYKPDFHPKNTPKCRCNIATVLRVVQRKKENRGRYMWMCHAGQSPDRKDGCSFFQWAEFDEDGNPPWAQRKENEIKT